jgi:carbon storage regulator
MLVLNRRKGERICIGSAIEIVVLSIRGSQVQLGLSAPRDVPIHRQELRRRIEETDGPHAQEQPITGGGRQGVRP